MKKTHSHVVLFFCIIFLLCTATVVGASTTHKATDTDYRKYNLKQIKVQDLDINKVGKKSGGHRGVQSLPAKYDPRNTEWFQTASVMKDQQDTGLCWAFSTTTAAELSYYLETYGKVGSGKILETSPSHLGFFFFNRVNDPLGNTDGDANVSLYDDWMDTGGDVLYTQQAMANWTGLAAESVCPFNKRFEGFNDSYSYRNYITQENSQLISVEDRDAIKEAIMDKGAVVAPYNALDFYDSEKATEKGTVYNHYCYDGEEYSNHEVAVIGWDDNYSKENFKGSLEDGCWFNPLNEIEKAKEIKDLELGVTSLQVLSEDYKVSVVSFSPQKSGTYSFISSPANDQDTDNIAFLCKSDIVLAYNDDALIDEEEYNDSFCFRLTYSLIAGETYYIVSSTIDEEDEPDAQYNICVEEGGEVEDYILFDIPENDGAWIIQNSWGSDYEQYYISYEDKTFGKINDDEFYVRALDMQKATDYKYNYQYDGSAGVESIPIGIGERVANVFEVGDENRKLDAIGFTTWNDGNTGYSVNIYLNIQNESNPTLGDLAFTKTYYSDVPGTYTYNIAEFADIELVANSRFSIVVSPNQNTSFGVEKNSDAGWVEFTAATDAGQSFFCDGNRWSDLSDDELCARIKAFVNEKSTVNDIEDADIEQIEDQVYTGREIRPNVIISCDGIPLVEDEDYLLDYSHNINVGLGQITITGIGEYQGITTYNFDIVPKSISDNSISIDDILDYAFVDRPIHPQVMIRDEETILTRNVDYKLEYTNNIDVGNNAKVIVKGIGNYSGERYKSFCISESEEAAYDGTDSDVPINIQIGQDVWADIDEWNDESFSRYLYYKILIDDTQKGTYLLSSNEYLECGIYKIEEGDLDYQNDIVLDANGPRSFTFETGEYLLAMMLEKPTFKYRFRIDKLTINVGGDGVGPFNIGALDGETLNFNVVAESTIPEATLTYKWEMQTWYMDEWQELGDDDYLTYKVDFSETDYYDIRCTISDGNTEVEIYYYIRTPYTGIIIVSPENGYDRIELSDGGEPITITVQARTYDNEELAYQWYKGEWISDEDDENTSTLIMKDPIEGAHEASYSTNNAGEYMCKVWRVGYEDDEDYTEVVRFTVEPAGSVKAYGVSGIIDCLPDKDAKCTLSLTSPDGMKGDTFSNITGAFSLDYVELGDYRLTLEGPAGYVTHEYYFSVNDSHVVINPMIRLLGDVDKNGEISAADVTQMARHIAKIQQIGDEYCHKLMDTDKNSEVSAADVTHLARYIAKLINTL